MKRTWDFVLNPDLNHAAPSHTARGKIKRELWRHADPVTVVCLANATGIDEETVAAELAVMRSFGEVKRNSGRWWAVSSVKRGGKRGAQATHGRK